MRERVGFASGWTRQRAAWATELGAACPCLPLLPLFDSVKQASEAGAVLPPLDPAILGRHVEPGRARHCQFDRDRAARRAAGRLPSHSLGLGCSVR